MDWYKRELGHLGKQAGVLLGAFLAACIIIALSGCVSKAPQPKGGATAKEVVAAVYTACLAGKLSDAAEYVENGPAVLAHDGALVKRRCEHVTDFGRIKEWTFQGEQQQGEEAVTLWSLGYLDKERGLLGRQLEWDLVRKGGRWLVVGVI